MEKLLHYVWNFRLYGLDALVTDTDETIEVLDPGLHNLDAGPDFLNAKIRVGGTTWVGSVEIHDRASDWMRHHHHTDVAYNNVILHIVGINDAQAFTADGRALPQLVLKVPAYVQQHYDELCLTTDYPRCWRIVKDIPKLTIDSWLSSLLVERISERAQRCLQRLDAVKGDWEHAFFITLAHNFGFGLNGETFDTWATKIPLHAAQKHRDNLLQLQALFLGSANLLDRATNNNTAEHIAVQPLLREWHFLANKFDIQPLVEPSQWRYLRLRPQNFPHQRMLQLAALFHRGTATFATLLHAANRKAIHAALSLPDASEYADAEVLPFSSTFSAATKDLFIINTIVPILFAHGLSQHDEAQQERALHLLDELRSEDNFMIRQWQQCGLSVTNAADTQALIQLKRCYCDRHDCLRCRFGYEYLKKRN